MYSPKIQLNDCVIYVYIPSQRWVTYLADNVDTAQHFYMVTVLTGMSKYSATTATVYISLTGDKATSAKHLLGDNNVKLFQNSGEDWFILAEEHTLGRLNGLTVWVDYSHTSPAW